MTATPIQDLKPYDAAWDMNGEWILAARRVAAETVVTVWAARSRDVGKAAEAAITRVAEARGVLVRTEGSIDCVLIYVRGDASAIVRQLGDERLTDRDYRNASRAKGEREVLRQVSTAGGELRADLIDVDAVSRELPLRHQPRDVLAALRDRGALRLERRKGHQPTWHLTDAGRALLAAEPTGDD